jgi:hypothetical protein
MRTWIAAVFAVGLAACGGDSDAPKKGPAAPPPAAPPVAGPAAEGAAGARAVVEAYLVAAKVPDESAMLALGTPEFQEKEKTWSKAFTLNIVKKGFALQSYEIREPAVTGDSANVSVRAVFSVNGKDDPEGMRFVLARRDGRWWITELH